MRTATSTRRSLHSTYLSSKEATTGGHAYECKSQFSPHRSPFRRWEQRLLVVLSLNHIVS